MIKPPETPECDKYMHLSYKFDMIEDFVDFLMRKGISFCQYDEERNRWTPHPYDGGTGNVEQMISDFLGIDLRKVKEERKALLQWERENNG